MSEKKTSIFDKIVTIILLAVILILAVLVGKNIITSNQVKNNMPRQAQNTSSTVNVSVQEIKPETYTQITTTGAEITTEQLSSYTITSEIGGKITKLLIGKDMAVKEGDIIAYVDPSVPGSQYKEQAVISSLTGTISSVNVYVGQTITTSTAIANVGGVGKLEIVAYLPERYLSTVKEGMKASFTTAAWPEESISATVKSISNTINASNRTFTATLSFDQDSRIKEGMYVTLSLVTDTEEGVFMVPSTALSTYLGDRVVYVVNGTNAERRTVTVGKSANAESVITSGLNAGDMVIVKGSVTNGSTINIVE